MRIASVATHLPSHAISTERMIQNYPCELSEEVKRNIANLGVQTRHFSTPLSELFAGEESESLRIAKICAKAATALTHKGIDPQTANYLITVSEDSDYLCPGLSNTLLRAIELPPETKNVNLQGLACSGLPKSLDLAEDHLARNPKDRVLIILSGVNSRWFCSSLQGLGRVIGPREIRHIRDEERRSAELRKWIAVIQSFLFGDGAAALLVENVAEGPEVAVTAHITNLGDDHSAGFIRLESTGTGLAFKLGSQMEPRLLDLGLQYTRRLTNALFGHDSVDSSIRKWAVHTGSREMVEKIRSVYRLPTEMTKESLKTLENCGNLAGASLPFILEKILREGSLNTGEKILLLGFGWGFSASASLLKF